MKTMTVLDITGLIGPNTRVLIHDRKSEDGTVFDGALMELPGTWNGREVVWMRPITGGFILEVE